MRYRAFDDATVSLGALTAFVGPNASGKSSLLRACAGGRFGARDVRGLTGRGTIERGPGTGRTFDQSTNADFAELGPVLRLRANEIAEVQQVKAERRLAQTGANLANVIATMPRRQRELLAQEFSELVPVFGDVDIRPAPQGGHHRIVFQDRWSSSVWYEPTEVSDGSLFALALVALQYQPDAPQLVAIEEPDHGLHPHLLASIVDVMRALSTRTSSPIQVLLATQSSELLNLLRPEEVRFLTRHADGSVGIEPADTSTPKWKEAWEAHQQSLASLWLSGSAGGVP